MSFKTLLRAFAGNSHGGAAPMLALAALPLFGFVGAAVDYSRAASARTAMQAALDATALMLSKEAPNNTGNLNQKANDIFKTMFTRPEAYNLLVTTEFTQPQQGSFSLTMKGSATVDTMFSK
ncbi:MAG TPA: Tad domain-containing protein, partial [Burkholderiales bacterium]|nr:Tad domain-containing protein [Burkholderiales bacterium]